MKVILPNLYLINLDNLPSFVDICEGYKLQAEKLQVLMIYKCPKVCRSLKELSFAVQPK